MTNREWVIRFMVLKNVLLTQNMIEIGKTPIKLTRKDDLMNLYIWSEETLSNIKKSIVESLEDDKVSDSTICPWCILTNENCVECSYGARNGHCDEEESPYWSLSDSLDTYISCIITDEWHNGTRFNLLKKYI